MVVVNRAEVERRMKENLVTRYTLQRDYGMNYATVDDVLESKQSVNMRTIGVFCDALKCQPCDILMKVRDE